MKDWIKAGRERDAVRMAHPLAELPNGRVVDEGDITTWTSTEWRRFAAALAVLMTTLLAAALVLVLVG